MFVIDRRTVNTGFFIGTLFKVRFVQDFGYTRYNKVSLELPDYKINSHILIYINVFNIDCANIVTRLKYLAQDPKVKIIEFKNIIKERIYFYPAICVILNINKEGKINFIVIDSWTYQRISFT